MLSVCGQKRARKLLLPRSGPSRLPAAAAAVITAVRAAATAAAVVIVVQAAAAVAAAAEQDEQDNDYPEAAVISIVAEHSFDLSPH